MNKRTCIAGILGALAMYLWIFVAHMLTPLGEAGIRQIDNEAALLAEMKSTIPTAGFYMFPRMNSGESEADYQRKMASGPSGMLIYFPTRDFQFGRSLVIEFLTELTVVSIAMYLLSLTSIGTFAGRLGFFALIGIPIACATTVSLWNWYGFGGIYTLAACFTGWTGHLAAGLVAAVMKIGGRPATPLPPTI